MNSTINHLKDVFEIMENRFKVERKKANENSAEKIDAFCKSRHESTECYCEEIKNLILNGIGNYEI